MSLRARPTNRPLYRESDLTTRKQYVNIRNDPRTAHSHKRKREHIHNTPTACHPSKKRKSKSKGWGNRTKQPNQRRLLQKEAQRSQTDKLYNEYIDDIQAKISEFQHKKMTWSDHRLIDKYHVVKLWYATQIKHDQHLWVDRKSGAYSIVGKQYDVCERTIRTYVKEYESAHELARSLQGHYKKVIEGLNTVELVLEFKSHVDAQIKSKRRVTAAKIRVWVNEHLLVERVRQRGRGYANNTVEAWLHEQGYVFGKHNKSTYIDGHNRADVVAVSTCSCSERKM